MLSVAEVIVASLGLFALYKIIYAELGLAALGIWSLVVASTAIARLGDAGITAGLSRFVALAGGESDRDPVSYASTALVSNVVLFVLLAALAYYPAYSALALSAGEAQLAEARELLPYALVSLVSSVAAGTISAGLIGQHRTDQKSILSIAGTAILLGTTYALISSFGLRATAIAQISQNIFILIASWILFVRNLKSGPRFVIPFRWDLDTFREILRFGAGLQAANLINMLYEPGTKMVLSAVAGLEALGLFEMAQRLVQQVRQVVVMPTQTLIPAYVRASSSGEGAGEIYAGAFSAIALVGFGVTIALILLSPIISVIWLSSIDQTFFVVLTIQAIGWLINLLGVPSYLLAVANGRTLNNVYGHLITTICSPLLGYFLGTAFGVIGAAAAASGSLAAGSLLSQTLNCRENGITLKKHTLRRSSFLKSPL